MKKFYEFQGHKFDITALQNEEQAKDFEYRLKREMRNIYNLCMDYGDEHAKAKQEIFLQNEAQNIVPKVIRTAASVERHRKFLELMDEKYKAQLAEKQETKEKMDIDNIEKPDTQDSNSMAKKRHKSNNRIPDDSLPTHYSVKVQSSDNVSYNHRTNSQRKNHIVGSGSANSKGL